MTRAAIKHKEEELRRAMLEGDIDALDRLAHPSLVVQRPDGAILRKEEDMAVHRAGRRTLAKLDTSELAIEIVSPDLAVVTLVVAIEGAFDGRPFAGRFGAVRTWFRTPDHDWRVVASAMAAKPDARSA